MSKVAICVCTCKRPRMLDACLASLSAQRDAGDRISIVVVDNEEEPNNLPVVERARQTCPYPITYIHQPKRGIASARNAALDGAIGLGAEWIAFIDDDETAAPDWIRSLMAEEYRDASILIGKVEPVYSGQRSFWSPDPKERVLEEGAPARHLSTANLRFRAEIARQLRFDEALNLTGGEDQRFLSQAVELGYRALQTNRAVVYAPVHPQRTTWRFQVSRHLAHEASLTHRKRLARGVLPVAAGIPLLLVSVPVGALELAISPVAGLVSRRKFRQFAMRGSKRFATAAGRLSGLCGVLPEPYRSIQGD